jgi:hypothetical protein
MARWRAPEQAPPGHRARHLSEAQKSEIGEARKTLPVPTTQQILGSPYRAATRRGKLERGSSIPSGS